MIEDLEIFRSVLDQSPEGVVVFNGETIVYCNQSFCDQLGYHKLELLHHPIEGFLPASFRLKHKQIIEQQKLSKNKEAYYEKPLLAKDGKIVWLNAVSKVIEMNEVVYRVSFYRDELDYKAQKEQLMESTKRINEYSFLTSHKLRHPIANILGLINLFDTENLANPENRSLFEYLKQASFQLNEVVHELNQTLHSKKFQDELNIFRKPDFPKVVMLIDDDSINLFITKSVINRVDPKMRVVTFNNPKEALQYLIEGKDMPDLILLDLGLRWMNEWDFLSSLESHQIHKIPCYVFRNFIDIVDKTNARNHSYFKDFILKPVTTDKLNLVFNS